MDQAAESTEVEDSRQVKAEKYAQIRRLVRRAIDEGGKVVVLTGAGVSTAANVPDFRGENRMKTFPKEHELDAVMPTYAHLVAARLVEKGIVSYIVTSNHDNLHRKAGVTATHISELFGNAFVERCASCRTKYLRSVVVPGLNRTCDDASCGGKLKKTGCRFGQTMDPEPLQAAIDNVTGVQLAIVLGSSMLVSPFSDMSLRTEKFVIANLQKTPYDSQATVQVHAKCDEVMRAVAEETGVVVDSFEYRQDFRIVWSTNGIGQVQVALVGGRPNEPCSCIEIMSVFEEGNPCVLAEAEGGMKNEFVVDILPPSASPRLTVQLKVKDVFAPDVPLLESVIDLRASHSGATDLFFVQVYPVPVPELIE